MRSRLAVALLCCTALCPAVRADRFWFGPVDQADKLAGSPDAIEGVLLREEGDSYVIRVAGGEITLAKAMVAKVEKTDLTVAQIEEREKAARDKLAQADRKRGQVQAAEASASRAAATAAAKRRQAQQRDLRVVVDFQGILPSYVFKTFDPVLDRVDLTGLARVVEDYLRVEVERAANRR